MTAYISIIVSVLALGVSVGTYFVSSYNQIITSAVQQQSRANLLVKKAESILYFAESVEENSGSINIPEGASPDRLHAKAEKLYSAAKSSEDSINHQLDKLQPGIPAFKDILKQTHTMHTIQQYELALNKAYYALTEIESYAQVVSQQTGVRFVSMDIPK
ncbi:hypothetical protein [Salinicola sp. CPA57]|uniref:hypothetical protein n=1 Tax=Salinicola sp. CPA57 TaxID=1949080 RepID=UPI000DA18AF4|nr:hypothetical protein [Salinicola sp. CPA57]